MRLQKYQFKKDLGYDIKIRFYPDSGSGTVIVVPGFFKQDLKDWDLFGRLTHGVNLNNGKKIAFLRLQNKPFRLTETSRSGGPAPNIDGLLQGPCVTTGCFVLAHNHKCSCLCSLSSEPSCYFGCLLELLWCRRARRNRADKTLHGYDGKFARSTLLIFWAFLMCSPHVVSHTYLDNF